MPPIGNEGALEMARNKNDGNSVYAFITILNS